MTSYTFCFKIDIQHHVSGGKGPAKNHTSLCYVTYIKYKGLPKREGLSKHSLKPWKPSANEVSDKSIV